MSKFRVYTKSNYRSSFKLKYTGREFTGNGIIYAPYIPVIVNKTESSRSKHQREIREWLFSKEKL